VTGVAPIVALFGLVEWLLLTDRASFTAAIAFAWPPTADPKALTGRVTVSEIAPAEAAGSRE
jgi:hypothetical protein